MVSKNTEVLGLLKQPVLPLVNMVEFLYLRGPFKKISEVLNLLTKPVELEGSKCDAAQ